MMPVFANPTGLWMLLGLPAVLAIHFLQQRARVARTSTWFLIEKLAPDSARGRTWDRLRSSRTLWLQLIAVILATWLLGEPRWVRAESAQTIVLVLDASTSMNAFRAPAIAAAEREMALADGLAARTTWIVMTTDPRQPALYRGLERAAATAALSDWKPDLGRHDLAPALRLARTLAGAAGRTLLITDAREKAPPDQRTAGVGRPIENVGFAGATVTRDPDSAGHTWRALIKNHVATAQERSWHFEARGMRSPAQPLRLAPGALTEISARFPAGVDRATIVLSDDSFFADDRLPLIVPAPKPLMVAIEGNDEPAEFFRKIAATIDGVTIVEAGAPATLRMAQVTLDALAREPRGGIFWPPPDQRAQAALLNESVTPERDALVAGLNWQGWFGTGPHGFTTAPGDTTLLWHGRWPIVFVRDSAPDGAASANQRDESTDLGTTAGSKTATRTRKLVFAIDWATSNASRLPATVLLVRRFIEAERDAQRAAYRANFDCGAAIGLAGVPLEGSLTMTFEPAAREGDSALTSSTEASTVAAATASATETREISPAEISGLRVPGRAGFFAVHRGDELLVQGSAQFADPRQGDFRTAETFFNEVRSERKEAIERHTRPDPWAPLWLVLLAGVVLWSWWSPARHGRAGVSRVAEPNAGGTPALPR